MDLNQMQKRIWAEVDLDALEYNYKILREHTPKSAKTCCVVKADAYGHGAVRVAKLYEEIGADFLAVSNIIEAMTIRNAGVKLPILVLGYTHPSCAMILAQNRISQCVYSYEYGKALAKEALACGAKLSIHIKIDVGMGRLGFIFRSDDDTSYKEVLDICKAPCFYTEGIFTHFPVADEGENGREETTAQFNHFVSIVEKLEQNGARFYIKHCSNSAAAIAYPEFSLDMVRLGISLYGVDPLQSEKRFTLKGTISLKTIVSHVKTVKKGEAIGYGSEYVADKDTVIATLPIGYGDGFKRENFENGTQFYINGELCPITGRVCMDQTMVNISNVQNVRCSTEAIAYGAESPISIEDFSAKNTKIPYETMCEISARVPRVYYRGDKIDSVRDSLI